MELDSDIHGLFQKWEGNASYTKELPDTRLFVSPPVSLLAFFLYYNTQVLFSAQTLKKKTYYCFVSSCCGFVLDVANTERF